MYLSLIKEAFTRSIVTEKYRPLEPLDASMSKPNIIASNNKKEEMMEGGEQVKRRKGSKKKKTSVTKRPRSPEVGIEEVER